MIKLNKKTRARLILVVTFYAGYIAGLIAFLILSLLFSR